MEPTFTAGQVVFYFNSAIKQYYPAVITEVSLQQDRVEYKLEVQAGTGHSLRSEETIASQDSILTFKEFTEVLRQEDASS